MTTSGVSPIARAALLMAEVVILSTACTDKTPGDSARSTAVQQGGFVPDPALAEFWKPLDVKYFAVFLDALKMIRDRQFDGLVGHYTKDLLVDARASARSVSVGDLKEHPPIVFRFGKGPALEESTGTIHPIRFPIDWRADPYKNNTWIFTFHSLLWLKEYLARGEKGDETAALMSFKVIRDWLLANASWPPENGRFAFGDHATAERLRILYRSLRLYRASALRDRGFEKLLLAGLLAHVALMITTERYLAWHNHAIIFDRILLEVLSDFAEIKHREEMLELTGRRVMEQFRFSFTSEGVHKEHSPCYHFFVTEMMVGAFELIERGGKAVPKKFRELADRTARFGAHVIKPDGSLPGIGDCTKGKGRKWSNQAGRKYYQLHPQLRFAMTEGKEGNKPERPFCVFPESGWAIFRNGWRPAAETTYAVVQSDFYSFGHYQEDDTSFVLSAFGHDLVIDPGLHSYNRAPKDVFMRRSRAHNVLLVDDVDFEFNLENTGLSGITRWVVIDPGEDGVTRALVELTHAHYERLGVEVHRQFGPIAEGAFLVRDLMKTENDHEYAQLYHFAPGAKIEPRGDSFLVTWKDHPNAIRLKSSFYSYEVIVGRENPVQGWYFPRFGESTPAPVLKLVKEGEHREFRSILAVVGPDRQPDWDSLSAEADRLIEAISKEPRRSLHKQPTPPKWKFRRPD